MSPRDRLLAICLGLVIITTAVFWRVRDFSFVTLDDPILVYDNKLYQPNSKKSLREVWLRPIEQIYMPLTYTAWATLAPMARVVPPTDSDPALNAQVEKQEARRFVSGLDPGIFHSFNLLLHVLSVLLVFAILRLLVNHDWAAVVGALLFALHPIQVESVAWISELKGVLSGFFGLLALWLYVCHVKAWTTQSTAQEIEPQEIESPSVSLDEAGGASDGTQVTPSRAGNGSWPLYAAAIVAFVLALLAKPSAACLPFVAWAIDYFFLRRSTREAALRLAPWLVLLIPIVLKAREGQPVTPFGPLWTRPLIALDALAFYIGKILWPFNLSVEYTRIPRLVLEQGWAYWTWILPVAVAVLLWRLRRPSLTGSAAIFTAGLLPVLGLVPFVFQFYSTVADRYVYLAMLGPALALSYVAGYLATRRPRVPVWGACVLLVIVLGVIGFSQIGIWRDSTTLYRHTMRINSRAWFARNNLARHYLSQNQPEEAEKLYREAIALRPDLTESYASLGGILQQQGKVNEAIDVLVQAAEKAAPLWANYVNLGQAYLTIKKYDYALQAFQFAYEMDPKQVKTLFSLADCHLGLRNFPQAQMYLQKAHKLSVNQQSFHYTVATQMVKHSFLTEAIPHYVEALKLAPNEPVLHNDLGVTLIKLGNYKAASLALENALRLDANYPEAHHNLGVALLQQKQYEKSITHFRRAIQLNPKYHEAYYAMGDALLRQGKVVPARAAFTQALRIKPDYALARQALRSMQSKGVTKSRG